MDGSGMRFSEPNYHGWSVDEDDFSDEYEELFSDEEASQSANMDENLDCLHFNGKKYEDLRSSDMIGVEFSSVKEVDTFYAYYSLAMGFSFRKEKLCRNAAQVVVRRQLVCSKEGERKKRGKSDPSFASEIISCAKNTSPPHGTKPVCKRKTVNQKPIVEDADTRSMKRSGKQFGDGEHEKKRQRPPQRNITRGNCQARITARRCKENGVFRVVQFITEHNHDLATTEFVPFLRSHRKVRDHDVAQVTALKKVSVGTCRAYELLVHQAGGHEFFGFLIKDLYNKMDSEGRNSWLMVTPSPQLVS
ncbi:putative transcription factor FAR family [Rosa chinensis]|uniref:Putative transcription factor FAR family n=1 Tax=Rosa chinensis TaxID=74649 RepID=A0A2P6QD18_ROSCH|nr:putative transcription factor FAR family [Rosa chinensis]